MTNDPFTLAQQFRIALYREYINAKGCTPQDVWQTWLTMPYDGPGRREILEEMKKEWLKNK